MGNANTPLHPISLSSSGSERNDREVFLREALDAAWAVSDPLLRADALLGLAPHASQGEQEAIVKYAISTLYFRQSVTERATIFRKLYPIITKEHAQRLSRNIIDDFHYARRDGDQILLINALGPIVSADRRQEMLDDVFADMARLRPEEGLPTTLESLAPILPESLAVEALPIAKGVKDRRIRTRILASLAAKLKDEARDSVVREILDQTDFTDSVEYKLSDIRDIIQFIPHVRHRELIGELLLNCNPTTEFEIWASALSSLLIELPKVEQNAAVQEALYVIDKNFGEQGRVTVLARMASLLPADRLEFLINYLSVTDYDPDRFEIILSTVPYLTVPQLTIVLNAARKISNDYYRAAAYAVLIDQIDSIHANMVLNLDGDYFDIYPSAGDQRKDERHVSYTRINDDKLLETLRERGISDSTREIVAAELTKRNPLEGASPADRPVAETAPKMGDADELFGPDRQTGESPHPGELIKTLLEHRNITVAEAAATLGVTRQQLYRVFNGDSDVSVEMALKLEIGFGTPAADWLRMQAEYDLAQLRAKKATSKEGHSRRSGPNLT